MDLDSAQLKRTTNRWARTIHVYTSMVALLVVLFFGLTGITLNHPEWTFGDATERSTIAGTLPFAVETDAVVNWLPIAEYVREEHDVKGTVDAFSATSTEGSITFKNPGYAADLFFDVGTGAYELTIEQQGFVAVMNDLHKGRNTGSAWSWVIDLSAGFLVVIAVTGLVMQLFLRKRRLPALITAGAGALVAIVLIWITMA